ncbi:hypothetical protein SAY86_026865 [Trapa natans]|uniref:Protein SIEVE ELEMENT OCCLUSION B-like n=1 Tax=Trapa natans TaxID=22666 RepID=A0AAN7KM93_TRANT|nr:hypothetical protein SAY86_026865 [Trapa natans]
MAGIVSQMVFGKPERNKQVDQSLLAGLLGMFDDEKFVKEMLNSHAPDEGEIDDYSLFVLAENTLKAATTIVDGVASPKGAPPAPVDYKSPKEGFNPPLEAISEVTCQLTCKALDTKNVRETMVSLFQELSHYSWVGKAVVTLSSIAIYYADFWRLAQVEPSDKLGESVAILKGLPAITKPADATKIQVFGVLNEMIKIILDMTGCIVEFEQESKDVPELSTAIDISTSVTQIIISILACSIQFTTLISVMVDESKGKDLPAFARKVNMINHTIKSQLEDFKQKKEEIREYQRLQRLFNAPTDNVELIKAFFCIKDEPQPLFLGSTKTTDKIDSLRRKNVLLLISDLKLSSYDLSIMVNIYNRPKFQESRYEIVWVPIVVDQKETDIDTTTTKQQFEDLQTQMPWYSARYPSLINKVAVKIVREKWHFQQETIVVALDPQGKVECHNAVHMIRMWGLEAFPFTDSVVMTIWKRRDISWFELLLNDSMIPNIQEAIKLEKLIFLYGSEDAKLVQELDEGIKKMADDSGTAINAFNVTKVALFWTRLESCMFSMMQAQIDVLDTLMQDILKLYASFKKDGGFALLAKGSRVVISCTLSSASKVVANYDEWKKVVGIDGMTIETAFKVQHDQSVAPETCYHFYIPNTAGHMPEEVKCPVCPRTMRKIIKFECCHGAH